MLPSHSPGVPEFPEFVGSLSSRHCTVLLSRDQKEERLRAAIRSGEKAGVFNGESMPAAQDPSLRNIMLGVHADRRMGDRMPEEENMRKL